MSDKSLFWADQLADEIINKGKEINIRCGQTPSGGKHIGNLNDVLRAYFVYKAVVKKGLKANFVHSTDDRDPLKDIPSRLADLDGNWHSSEKFPELKNFLGRPLCRIPDPFGCCKSWSEHFTKVWEKGLNILGIFPVIVSNDVYYKEGRFDKYIKTVFEKKIEAGKIVSKFQGTKSEDYIPFDAICQKCGTLANISSFDIEKKLVYFTCGGKAIKKRKSEGCGFEGSAPWSEGKLQWRFEWPAQWGIEKTVFEPFGKDHFEGSWKSGQVIAKEIYGIEPPLHYVYEFFLVDGRKMSASVGNVYIVQDILKIIEPEIFLYYYTKKPAKQRDLSLKDIGFLADEFERLEELYFNPDEIKNEKERENIKTIYETVMDKIPDRQPVRIPYSYVSLLAQVLPKDGILEKAIEILGKTGHIKGEISYDDKKRIEIRLKLAENWAEKYADERYKIKLLENPKPDLTDKQKKALKILSAKLEENEYDENELNNIFRQIAEEAGIDAKQFFSGVYQALLGKEHGPKLAGFILAVSRKKVADILKRVG